MTPADLLAHLELAPASRDAGQINGPIAQLDRCPVYPSTTSTFRSSPVADMDVWASGDAYEPYIGRWSQLVAHEFLAWIDVPRGARWLDVGCGTGALTDVIAREAHPAAVQSVDPSPAYIASHVAACPICVPRSLWPTHDCFRSVREVSMSPCPGSRSTSSRARKTRLPRSRESFARAAWRPRTCGTTPDACSSFGTSGMPRLRSIPKPRALDEARRFPDCNPAALEALFRARRVHRGRDTCDRRSNALSRFRRLLDAVPGRAGAGTRLRHEPERVAAGRASRAASRDTPGSCRRLDRPHRARLGGAGNSYLT